MARQHGSSESDSLLGADPAIFAIAWSPEVLTADEYAHVVGLLGNLVRALDALGVERVRSEMAELEIGATALV